MLYSKIVAADLAELLAAHGVKYAIISPGSRNAPLTLSLESIAAIHCISVPDERVAAFYALGIAQKTLSPVVVTCTSGSALLNFAPAASEALYQQIPIIILSADRPPEWIDQGDGQTIRQSGALNNSVKKWLNLMPDDENPDSRWFNQRQINYALIAANEHPKGPVHINIPLREPLYKLQEPQIGSAKIIKLIKPQASIENLQFTKPIVEAFGTFKKVMIIAGQMLPSLPLKSAIEKMASLPNVVILTESHSNLFSEKTINCIDRDLAAVNTDDEAFKPDLLISVGHNFISKKIKAYLRTVAGLEHWHFGPSALLEDTFKALTLSVEAEPDILFEAILAAHKTDSLTSAFKEKWNLAKHKGEQFGNAFAAQQPWNDLSVFYHLMQALPENIVLQMGNSSVVRYIQLFERSNHVLYFGNRGTSGIDGSTSTAAGYSLVEEKDVYIITGDVSFFYDSNAFWCNALKGNLKVILINNGGGGIFRIIEGPNNIPGFEHFLETVHTNNAEGICKAYQLQYHAATTLETLQEGLEKLRENNHKRPVVLEVFTPRLENADALKHFFKYIKLEGQL
ncbi:MAG: 2-succinyl-5-enolpyruvyl-6-hydroxy-3-cyclohexene-1-carboxylic-acid synthase [Luteibaculaceae bacterium]